MRPDPHPFLAEAVAAMARAAQPQELFHAIDHALERALGHVLFTILVHHPNEHANERFYTNRPADYPIGGRKPVTDTAWTRQVIGRGEPYIGRSARDIREVFFDHALILSLGCESVLNVPVRWRGETLGTLNLLDRANHYDEGDLATARLFAALALPGVLMVSER